eukprot:Amastigsp_a676481_41.p2 type:complete len:221 gc:universal Amastigsp_a676481_41:1115-453(-)
MPSSSALCASMGPGTTSPMANTFGMLVRKQLSTGITPRSFILMPSSFAPSLSVNARRPMETRTASNSAFSLAPFFTPSSARLTPAGVSDPPVTLVETFMLRPCFLSSRSKALATSPSIPAPMASLNSMTVTAEPSRDQTEPSSSPMTPPPMTAMRLGGASNASAPVDETTFFSSKGRNGSAMGSEPVAITMFLVEMVCLPPPMSSTSTEFADARRPEPLT